MLKRIEAQKAEEKKEENSEAGEEDQAQQDATEWLATDKPDKPSFAVSSGLLQIFVDLRIEDKPLSAVD